MMGSQEKYVFQGVHMLLNMGSSSQLGLQLQPWKEGEKHMNKLCFIGRNLDRAKLAADLQACIFDGKFPDPGPVPAEKPRFDVGTPVLVNVGTWLPGTVVAHWYRELLWETGRYAPYQVELEADDGQEPDLVWAPRDTNKFIKARPEGSKRPKGKGKAKK